MVYSAEKSQAGLSNQIICTAALYYPQNVTQLHEKIQTQKIDIINYTNQSIEGTVTSDSKKTLFLSIPYDDGWTATVDGEKAKINKIGTALSGIDISSGTHSIVLNYVPSGFEVGMIISIMGGMFLLIFFVTEIKKNRKCVLERRNAENG